MIRVSASQIANFRDCPRKWWFDKVAKVPRPEHAAAKLGTEIHADLERYYREGTPPTLREALALIPLLPPKTNDLTPEAALDFLLFPDLGVRVKGYIDLLDLKAGWIWDYKSTSSIDRYAKTKEDLYKDPQALIYGLGVRLEQKEQGLPEVSTEVDLSWMYVQTKSSRTAMPKTKPVHIRQTLTILEDGLDDLRKTVVEMIPAEKEADQDQVPVNLGACWKYGGCPYRDQCSAYQANRSFSAQPKEEQPVPDQSKLDILAKLRKKDPIPALADTPTPHIPDNPPPTPAVTAPEMPKLPVPADAVPSEVLPPDAAPDVSVEDPPPPPQVEPKTRGRKPKAVTQEAPPPAPPSTADEVESVAAQAKLYRAVALIKDVIKVAVDTDRIKTVIHCSHAIADLTEIAEMFDDAEEN